MCEGLHEEPEVCEFGIVAGGQGRSAKDMSNATTPVAIVFLAVFVVPAIVGLFINFFSWIHNLMLK